MADWYMKPGKNFVELDHAMPADWAEKHGTVECPHLQLAADAAALIDQMMWKGKAPRISSTK